MASILGDDDDAVALLPSEPIPKLAPNTLTSHAAFRARLAEIRRRGWGIAQEEFHPGVACIGVPWTVPGYDLPAAMCCIGLLDHVHSHTTRLEQILRAASSPGATESTILARAARWLPVGPQAGHRLVLVVADHHADCRHQRGHERKQARPPHHEGRQLDLGQEGMEWDSPRNWPPTSNSYVFSPRARSSCAIRFLASRSAWRRRMRFVTQDNERCGQRARLWGTTAPRVAP